MWLHVMMSSGVEGEEDAATSLPPRSSGRGTMQERYRRFEETAFDPTETCQTQQVEGSEGQERRAAPQLIVQVQTTSANEQDVEGTASIQHALAQADLLPDEQIVDTGYVDGDLLVSSHYADYGIRLVGPVLADTSWQAKAGKGFDLSGPFSGRLAEAGGDLVPARPVQLLVVGAARPHRSEVRPQNLCRLPLLPGLHTCHQRWPGGASAAAASA